MQVRAFERYTSLMHVAPYCKIIIYVHNNPLAPHTSDLSEKLSLFFLCNFHQGPSLLKLIVKMLSPKIYVINIKT